MFQRLDIDGIERGLLYLGIILAPMREFRPTEIAFTYSDLVFCFLGGMMIVRRRLSIAPLKDITIIWMVAVLCLTGGLFASSILFGSPGDALVVCLQYFFAYGFLPFVLLRDGETALLLLKTMIFATLFIVVAGFLFAATGYDGGYTYITGSGRLASFAGNPNDFAMLIALTTPLLMYAWLSRAMNGLICLAIFVCFFIGLIMASSNSGIASAILGITAFLLFSGSIRGLLKVGTLGAALLLLAATVGYDYLPEVFQKRVLSALESGSLDRAGTYKDRMELIYEASDLLDGSLLLGIGADQYRVHSSHQVPVHNQYLLVWVEGGTIALFGWLLILATMAFIGIRSYAQPRDGPKCAAMVLATAMIIAIVANTSPHLYARFWVTPILIAIGLTLARRLPEPIRAASMPPGMLPPRPYGAPMAAPPFVNRHRG